MTCIVGLKHRNGVIIGADSAASEGWNVCGRKDRKVARVGPYAMGFTTSFRMGQLLLYAFEPPRPPRNADLLFRFMVTDFVDALRALLKSKGWAKKDSEQEVGGTFLVGVERRLFRVDSDYQVGEPLCGFEAVGCGAEVARGALFALRGLPPGERVHQALRAAEACNGGVRRPFHTASILK